MITAPLKYHGGKQPLAKWLHSLAPPSCRYEPQTGYTHRNIVMGGGLGEFWNWLPIDGISEAVNDTNHELANFYMVLRCPVFFKEFQRLCEFTQFAELGWEYAKTGSELVNKIFEVSVSSARDFFVRYRQSRQGLGKDYATPTTRTRRGMNENVSAWLSAVDGLQDCHERLRRVEIRNLDFAEFIRKYDHPKALFYCDPPYMHETRSSTGEYGPHEMTHDQHADLLRLLCKIEGKFMLSGYRSNLYDGWAQTGLWNRHERERPNSASSASVKEIKTECVWTNY